MTLHAYRRSPAADAKKPTFWRPSAELLSACLEFGEDLLFVVASVADRRQRHHTQTSSSWRTRASW